MKTLLFFVCSAALVFTFTTALAQNFYPSNHSSVVKSDNSSNDMSKTTNNQQISSNDSPDNQRNFTSINQNSNSSSSQRSYTSTSQNSNSPGQRSYTSTSQNTNSSGSQRSYVSTSQNSDASTYQHSSLNLSAVDLRQPHILSIHTSGSQLTGEIIVNGKVVKRLTKSREQINLSPLLSVGEHTVKISARYSPTSSSVNVELSGPGTNITQQDSGNGILKYAMDVSVH
ncbi:MAG: hypothetical protein PUP91_02290 [Rhizonema sp. PD37]|nr:hypothetical protein [Rhizonema sp. PD37]